MMFYYTNPTKSLARMKQTLNEGIVGPEAQERLKERIAELEESISDETIGEGTIGVTIITALQ